MSKSSGTSVTIAAAASLTDALNDAKKEIKKKLDIKEIDIYQGASGYLAGRILGTPPLEPLIADLFFSANLASMEELDEAERIVEYTPLLGNTLVLIRNNVDPLTSITGFGSLNFSNTIAQGVQIFVADPADYGDGTPMNVPAGIYARSTFRLAGNWRFIRRHATFAGMWNVRYVLSAVANCAGPAVGVVYLTDAMTQASKVTVIAQAPSCINNSIIYPLGIIANGPGVGADTEKVEDLYNFLCSEDGLKYFRNRGFRVLSDPI